MRFPSFYFLLIFNLILVSTVGKAMPSSRPLLTCWDLDRSSNRVLQVFAAGKYVEMTLTGYDKSIKGSMKDTSYIFRVKTPNDVDFLSLEITRVNDRFIGVLYEKAKYGDLPFIESHFACAETQPGGMSSNGG